VLGEENPLPSSIRSWRRRATVGERDVTIAQRQQAPESRPSIFHSKARMLPQVRSPEETEFSITRR